MHTQAAEEEIIRKTASVCPVCLDKVPAFVIEKENQVFLKKECPRHGGASLVLSSSPSYYRRLEQMYFSVMDEDKKTQDVMLYVTSRCNIRCPICFLSCNKDKSLDLGEPSLGEIEHFIKHSRQKYVILTGGEPTCREDLPEIIKLIRQSGKAVNMNTNGIRLVDKEYVSLLKKAGLQRVDIQFDGFSNPVEVELRGANYLPKKLQAIANIRESGIALGMNTVLGSSLGEHYFGSILEFIAREPHLVSVDFLTVSTIGSAGGRSPQGPMMPDQAVDMFVSESKGKFSKEKICLFQMLHMAVKSFLRIRFCYYHQIYLGVRTREGYLPVDAFLNFRHLEFWLEKYKVLFRKNRFLSGAPLLMGILSLFCSARSWQLAMELIPVGISYFVRSGRYLRPSKLFYIKFSTICDPAKIDYRIARNCCEVVWASAIGGKLDHQELEMDFFINREKAG